jgi:hypothetical protein
VDDVHANVEGAQQVGMTGVLHRDAAATIRALDGLMPDLLTMDPQTNRKQATGAGQGDEVAAQPALSASRAQGQG